MPHTSSSLPLIWRRTIAPALWGLRTYWGTALLLAGTAAAALTALLPVTSLLPTRLGLAPWRGGDLGMSWSPLAASPTTTQHAALLILLRLLLAVSSGVLAVGGLTIISLSVARASARTTEVRLRRAVGASRRQLLTAGLYESGAIALTALALGGVAGAVAARVAIAAWPGTGGAAARGPTVLAIAATLAGIVLGAVVPLLLPRRTAPLPGATGKPLELFVPALQLGLSLTVLTASALLARAAGRWLAPGGPAIARDLVFEVTAPVGPAATRAAAYASILRRLEGDHTLQLLSLTSPGALVGLGMVDKVTTDCGACAIDGIGVPWMTIPATHYLVSADTFRVLGLALAAGRGFTAADRWGARRVAVVNRHLAARYFQRGEAVGRVMRIGARAGAWYTVVGVVDDQRPTGFGGGLEPPDAVYLSVLQHPARSVDLLVRPPTGAGTLATLPQRLRDTLGTDGSRVAPISASQLAARETAPLRWFAGMFGAQGWVLLVVATLGTFVVMRLWIASLLYELGVRRAVGARRAAIVRFVLWRAVGVAVAGTAVGLWLGLLVWGPLATVVAGLPEWDAHTALRFVPLLVAAALAGALLPAWRAARATPTTLVHASV